MQISFKKIVPKSLGLGEFKAKVKKAFLFLGKDAFLVILFVLLVEVIFAELLFYKYVLSVDTQESFLASGFVGFKEDEYQSVVREWQARDDFLKNHPEDTVSNPFLQGK